MGGEYEVGSCGNPKIFCEVNSQGFKGFDFPLKNGWVKHHSVRDDVQFIFPKYAGKDRLTGFSFSGTDSASRADALVKTLQRALKLYLGPSSTWKKIRKAAAAERFSWADSIDAYLRQLYSRQG